MYERRPIDIMRHEAGHMLIAKLLGFYTGEIRFNANQAGANIIFDLNLPDIPTIKSFIERRVVVLYSGVLAESLSGGKVDNERALRLIRGPEGADDYSKARELIRLFAGITRGESDYQLLLDELDNRFWNRAANLSERYASAIDLVSRHCRQALGGRSEIVISSDEMKSIAAFGEIVFGSEINEPLKQS